MIEFKNRGDFDDKFALANPNPVLSSTADGELKFVNPAATQLTHDLNIRSVEDLLPDDHKSLVKACLATGVTLTDECQLEDRNIVWSYQSSGESDLIYIYGHDVTAYHLQVQDNISLPNANPNPVLTYSSEGKLLFKNNALLLLQERLGKETIEELLPANHKNLVAYCFKTGKPVTEECLTGGRCIVWSYQVLDDCESLAVYGYDVTGFNATRHVATQLPEFNPSPVLTTDSDGEPQFINQAASQIMLDLKIEHIRDMLPEDHCGMVKACLLTNTPLTKNHTKGEKTFVWSYLPVDGNDVIYIYGHDITDYHLID